MASAYPIEPRAELLLTKAVANGRTTKEQRKRHIIFHARLRPKRPYASHRRSAVDVMEVEWPACLARMALDERFWSILHHWGTADFWHMQSANVGSKISQQIPSRPSVGRTFPFTHPGSPGTLLFNPTPTTPFLGFSTVPRLAFTVRILFTFRGYRGEKHTYMSQRQ